MRLAGVGVSVLEMYRQLCCSVIDSIASFAGDHAEKDYLTATIFLVGISSLLTWSEFWWLDRRRRILSSTKGRVQALPIGTIWPLLASVGAAASAFVAPIRAPSFAALTVAFAVLALKFDFGREGSDQMALALTSSLALLLVLGGDGSLRRAVLLFIAGQLCLAYLASGLSKLAGRKWRDGSAVGAILATTDFGMGATAVHGKTAFALRLATWGTVFVELGIPVALAVGGPIAVVGLATGAAFHVGVAALMGLNRFLPWFLSTYPAAIWASWNYGLLR